MHARHSLKAALINTKSSSLLKTMYPTLSAEDKEAFETAYNLVFAGDEEKAKEILDACFQNKSTATVKAMSTDTVVTMLGQQAALNAMSGCTMPMGTGMILNPDALLLRTLEHSAKIMADTMMHKKLLTTLKKIAREEKIRLVETCKYPEIKTILEVATNLVRDGKKEDAIKLVELIPKVAPNDSEYTKAFIVSLTDLLVDILKEKAQQNKPVRMDTIIPTLSLLPPPVSARGSDQAPRDDIERKPCAI